MFSAVAFRSLTDHHGLRTRDGRCGETAPCKPSVLPLKSSGLPRQPEVIREPKGLQEPCWLPVSPCCWLGMKLGWASAENSWNYGTKRRRHLCLNLTPHQHQGHTAVPSSWVALSSDFLTRPTILLEQPPLVEVVPAHGMRRSLRSLPTWPSLLLILWRPTSKNHHQILCSSKISGGKSVLDHQNASSHLFKPLDLLSAPSAMGCWAYSSLCIHAEAPPSDLGISPPLNWGP